MRCLIFLLAVGFISAFANPPLSLKIKPPGAKQERPLGVSIVYTCELTDNGDDGEGDTDSETTGEDLPVYQWTDGNKKEITDKSGRRYVESTDEGMKLYINSIELEDAGSYICKVTHKGQSAEQKVTLELYQDIGFENVSLQQFPKIHTDALIYCKVTGRPVPDVSWKHKGFRLKMSDKDKGGKYSKMDNGLQIRNISKEDDGNYTCRAEVDSEGRYDEKTIAVEVHIPPTITQGLSSIEGTEGDIVNITCKADGLPSPTFSFFRDGEPVLSTDQILVDETRGVLRFNPVNKSDEGAYTCKQPMMSVMLALRENLKSMCHLIFTIGKTKLWQRQTG